MKVLTSYRIWIPDRPRSHLEPPLDDPRLHDVAEGLPAAAVRGPVGHSRRRDRLQVDAVVVDAVDRGEGLVHATREPTTN